MNDESFTTWIVVLRFTFQLGLTLHGFTSMHHKFILFSSFFFLRLRIYRESYIYLLSVIRIAHSQGSRQKIQFGQVAVLQFQSTASTWQQAFQEQLFCITLYLLVALGIIRPFCCLNSAERLIILAVNATFGGH